MPPRSETYLHGHHESVLRSHQWRTARIQPDTCWTL